MRVAGARPEAVAVPVAAAAVDKEKTNEKDRGPVGCRAEETYESNRIRRSNRLELESLPVVYSSIHSVHSILVVYNGSIQG